MDFGNGIIFISLSVFLARLKYYIVYRKGTLKNYKKHKYNV